MPSITKFYLHDVASNLNGTLPATGSTQSATTPTVTAAGAGTNRAMDSLVGSAQQTATLTSLANTTAQTFWFRRFVSPRLAAQTVNTGAWKARHAASEANANANFFITEGVLYFWRPSTGAVVGTKLYDLPATQVGVEPGVTETTNAEVTYGVSAASVTIQDGDVLIFELWGNTVAQGTATARVNNVFYDGNTEGSITSQAAYLLAPAAITLLNPLPQTVEDELHGDPFSVQTLDRVSVARRAFI